MKDKSDAVYGERAYLSKDQHRELKARASYNGVPMNQFTEEIIKLGLESYKKQKEN